MIQALVGYQEKDVELFKIEKELLESEDRKKAITAKKYLESVEENLSKLDFKAGELDMALKSALKEKQELEDDLKELTNALNSLETKEEADFILKKADQILGSIKKLSDEIERLDKDLKAVMQEHGKIALTTKKAKEQYSECGKKYNELKASKQEEINALKEQLAKLEKGVEEGLMTLYKEKRKSINRCPVLFPLRDKVCGACGMEFPQNALNKLKGGEVMVCEHCGRLVYFE